MNSLNKYDDIINLPHHISKKHKQMSIHDRAAQFAPFSALVGYDDEVKETERLTSKKIELNEEQKEVINKKIQEIKEHIKELPKRSITYFIADKNKEGGKYVITTMGIRKIDEYNKRLILEDNTSINIYEIIDIGEI